MSDAALLPLLWTAVAVVLLGAAALGRVLPLRVALAVMLAKVGLAASFALFGDPAPWGLLDDVKYFRQGLEFATREGDPFTFFLHPDRVFRLVTMSEGLHVLYGWYNYLMQWLVGPYYFAPVLGNVLMTAVAAAALHRLVEAAGAPLREARWTTLLFLVHWDVLAWSSFINVKDNLVVMLTVLLLLAYTRLARGITRGRVLAIVAVSGVFVFLRFYVPVLALGAFLLTSAAARGAIARYRWRLLALGVAMAGALYAALGRAAFELALTRLDLSPPSVIFGVVRILLTPQPWSLASNYEYLLLPSILHMCLVVPAMAGLASLWRGVPGARLAIAYYLLIVLVFASFPLQLGPRHRYQVVFLLAWGLVHVVREALPAISQWVRGMPPRAVAPHPEPRTP
jgi:hypothetical protein